MKQAGIAFGLLLAVAGLFVAFPPAPTGHDSTPPGFTPPALKPSPTAGGEIFDQPTVVDFQLLLSTTNLQALRDDPREYTMATAVVNGQEFPNVGIKLKGAAGSFRQVDDRPALTLNFSLGAEGRRVFGLRRLHLNNSVQDPSYLNEYLGSELFRAAGIPTPRVAWATVRINDRDLDLYVLKEAFEKEFLRTFFGTANGNLYEGGFVREIDQIQERASGDGPADASDIQRLVEAVREDNERRRWEKLGEVLDIDRFATYAALSVMLVDWDGYPLNRNNYRIYFPPEGGRAVFMPHGMDQLFQRSYLELDASWSGMVAWAALSSDEGLKLYEARCREVFKTVFQLARLTNTLHRAVAVLKPVKPDIIHRAAYLEDQIRSRLRVLKRDPFLKIPPPPAPAPEIAVRPSPTGIQPAEWRQQPNGDAALEGPDAREGRTTLGIVANRPSTASWRAELRLKAGRYRFEGKARTAGVEVVRDEKGEGAGLRLSGESQSRQNQLGGDSDWTTLSHEFEVAPPEAAVILVAELRARRGRAWFDRDSLRVVPVPR